MQNPVFVSTTTTRRLNGTTTLRRRSNIKEMKSLHRWRLKWLRTQFTYTCRGTVSRDWRRTVGVVTRVGTPSDRTNTERERLMDGTPTVRTNRSRMSTHSIKKHFLFTYIIFCFCLFVFKRRPRQKVQFGTDYVFDFFVNNGIYSKSTCQTLGLQVVVSKLISIDMVSTVISLFVSSIPGTGTSHLRSSFVYNKL